MNRTIAALATMGFWSQAYNHRFPTQQAKKPVICSLPSCENKTDGRDYCSAEHCHKHRQQINA